MRMNQEIRKEAGETRREARKVSKSGRLPESPERTGQDGKPGSSIFFLLTGEALASVREVSDFAGCCQ